jgi:hypothetical protein
MTKDEAGQATDRGRFAEPSQGNGDRDRTGTTGDAAMEGGKPSPGGGGPGEASGADGPEAIDLDSARDRAS